MCTYFFCFLVFLVCFGDDSTLTAGERKWFANVGVDGPAVGM